MHPETDSLSIRWSHSWGFTKALLSLASCGFATTVYSVLTLSITVDCHCYWLTASITVWMFLFAIHLERLNICFRTEFDCESGLHKPRPYHCISSFSTIVYSVLRTRFDYYSWLLLFWQLLFTLWLSLLTFQSALTLTVPQSQRLREVNTLTVAVTVTVWGLCRFGKLEEWSRPSSEIIAACQLTWKDTGETTLWYDLIGDHLDPSWQSFISTSL